MTQDNKPFFNLPSLKSMDKYEMDKFLDQEVRLEKYFSTKELEGMGPFEQKRYKNMVQNYQIMLHIGLPAVKPDFMKGTAFRAKQEEKRKRPAARLSSSDSDDEWTPDMERRKRAKEKKKMPTFLCKSKQKPSRTLPKRRTKVSKPKTEEVQRESYEFRKNRTTNYMNLEPPDDDHFLYCEDCNKDYEGDCPVHGRLIFVQDTQVEDGDPDRALHSLPSDIYVKESNINGAGMGAFTRKAIPARTMFGPYGGTIMKDPDLAHSSGYCWQIYKDGAASHFVDAKDKAHSNWMRYVNCALSEQDQNLVAFQYKGGIYYRSFKPILPETELLVWYGDEYARELGIDKDDGDLVKPVYVDGGCCYPCEYCSSSFSDIVYWAKHMKSKHATDKLTIEAIQRINRWLLTNHPVGKGNERTVKSNSFLTIDLGKAKNMCGCGKSNSCICTEMKHDLCLAMNPKHMQGNSSNSFDHHMNLTNYDKVSNKGNTGYLETICPKTETDVHEHTESKSESYVYNLNLATEKDTSEELGMSNKCNFCEKTFSDKKSYGLHIKQHVKETQAKYDMYKSYLSQNHISLNKQMVTEKWSNHCNTYGKSFDKEDHLATHKRIHTGDKPYKCEVSRKSFNRSGSLVNHKRIHTGDRPYKCEVCGKSFTEAGHLVGHKRIHTGEKPYKCEVCGNSFTEAGHLVAHKRIHTGDRPYKCEVCGNSFNQISNLVRHKRIHTGEKPYKCEVCGNSFTEAGHLVAHKRIHSGDRPYKCEVCGKSFTEAGHLVKHKRIHTGDKPYKCEVCGKSFTEAGHLVKHKRIHTGEKPYKCEVCGKSFTQAGHLVKHKRIHTGDKPYKCEVCGKSFTVAGHLVTHKRIHTGDKPYKCEVCGKSFTEAGHLVTHKRIHTGDRPYKCEVCGKSFTQAGHLVKHKRIHTGDKPYKCEVCGKSFTVAGHLVTHKRIHTGDKPYKCEVCGKSFTEAGHLVTHKRIHPGDRPYKCEVCGMSFSDSCSHARHRKQHKGV